MQDVCIVYSIWGKEMTEADPALVREALRGGLGEPLGHPNPVGCSLAWWLWLNFWHWHLLAVQLRENF